METILIYNERIPLVKCRQRQFNLEDGAGVFPLGRTSDNLEIPLTGKLLQFLKSCGINVPPTVTIGDSWLGPRILIGFDSFNVPSSSHKGYLQLCGLDRRFGLDNDDDYPLKNHNVSLRVDIDTLTDDVSNCSLKPDVMSHVLEVQWEEKSKLIQYAESQHAVCVTFKSAQISTGNNEDRLNVDMLQNWTRPGGNWILTMSLSLILAPKSNTERPDPDVSDHLISTRRMRTDETFADFTIITENGTQVKCHRAVLAVQSPYFARMLESGMKEARTGTVELLGMSTEGVGAMLDYFYTWNVAVLEGNPLVCVELLEAGHKFDIQPLEKCTKKIILSKLSDWYTPEAALRLIIYLKDMDMPDLNQKMVQVCKKKLPEIQKLPAYDKLGKENPQVFKQLFEYFLTV